MPAKIQLFNEMHQELLRDESRNIGYAESVSFPETEEDILEILKYCRDKKLSLTVQGALTGLAAGAVPYGGHVVNLKRMNKVLAIDQIGEEFTLTCQPGLILSELRKAIELKHFNNPNFSEASRKALAAISKKGSYVFPPDPTEASASLGGMVACNASGARTYFFGATREHITRLRLILSDGRILDIKRGQVKANGLKLELPLTNGAVLKIDLPKYKMPATKNAAGYYVAADMDALDLLIGSDGTLGLIVEIDIKLQRAPEFTWGISTFWPDEKSAIDFVLAARQRIKNLTSLESFDYWALELLRQQREKGGIFSSLPFLPEDYAYCIYLELQGDEEAKLLTALNQIKSLMDESGGDSSKTWVALNDTELTRLLFFRHAVPESVNMLIDQRKRKYPDIAKLGTDMAVPDDRLVEIIEIYRRDLKEANLQAASWGHIGDNHIHVNILPRNSEDYQRGKELYLRWAKKVTEMQGTVSAEHGVGKSKANMLEIMYGSEHVEEMRRLKLSFDPWNLLSPGNLFVAKGGVGHAHSSDD